MFIHSHIFFPMKFSVMFKLKLWLYMLGVNTNNHQYSIIVLFLLLSEEATTIKHV